MSQQLREFVKQSGVEVRPTNSPSSVSTTASNNALIREIEADMAFPPRLEKNIISNENYGEFAEFVHMSNSNDNTNEVIAMAMKPATPTLTFKISKLNPGMFNATVNKNFSAESRIDLKKILLKPPLPKTPIGEGLYLETREINGMYGRFTTGFSHTREYGKKGDLNKNFFTVQLKVLISDNNESKGATVNFYRNGKIRFSGGFLGTNISNQPELIRRFIVGNYSEKEAFLYNPFEYNNLSGQFRVNGIFKNLVLLTKRFVSNYGATDVKYDSELSPFMYLTYRGHKYILAKSGNIQISGAPTPADMLRAYTDGSQLAKVLYEKGEIYLTASVPNRLVKGKKVKSPKKKSILSKKQASALKIDAKQCMRMSKPELVDLAKKMGVVGITTSTKKGEICENIKKISGVKSATFRNTDKKKNVALVGSGKDFKVGRATCTGYSKTELLRVASILNIKLDPKETKVTLCKKIETARNAMLAPKPKPKTPPTRKEVAKKKRNVKKEQVIKKRGLSENAIRKDIVKLYGKRWMDRYKNVMPSLNNDVKEMKTRLNKLKTGNKQGIPFKRDVDIIKKRLVNRWKSERGRNLERKVIRTQLNVAGVPNRLVAQYRNAATNYIMNNGPTMKQLEKYKKTWLNLRNK
ncbi:MAG: hypothetical protein CMO46_10845 [Verrucomicrobiales bacterium]|nr:hypothetical protein [Verrucomicrobiales bacterium]|tara:strand:+ start:3518 stop:5428 length:1911 start_codon:yes stop_codon:yes gene_type:complete